MDYDEIEKHCRFCDYPWLASTVIDEQARKGYDAVQALKRFSRLGCAAFGRYGLEPGSHQPTD